mmetsp:Transcript_8581/g.18690  ORF Transcript_8581/g.18690 Transcript_8581/m.18690 type:complete len:262 (-) Transcript_8581:56-841(-)
MACAWACYHSRCTDIQRRAGFDGWVAILEGPYDTDDQAWPQEQQRIRLAARSLTRHAESSGVDLERLQLTCSVGLLLEPPPAGDERVWCIEHFASKMYDLLTDAADLTYRLLALEESLREDLACQTGSAAHLPAEMQPRDDLGESGSDDEPSPCLAGRAHAQPHAHAHGHVHAHAHGHVPARLVERWPPSKAEASKEVSKAEAPRAEANKCAALSVGREAAAAAAREVEAEAHGTLAERSSGVSSRSAHSLAQCGAPPFQS